MRQVADPQLTAIISSLVSILRKFTCAQGMAEKLNALEEVYFYIEMEFSLLGREDSSLKDYILKLAVSKVDDLFVLYVHFKMAHDFYLSSNTEFIEPEFLNSLDIIIQSLVN